MSIIFSGPALKPSLLRVREKLSAKAHSVSYTLAALPRLAGQKEEAWDIKRKTGEPKLCLSRVTLPYRICRTERNAKKNYATRESIRQLVERMTDTQNNSSVCQGEAIRK